MGFMSVCVKVEGMMKQWPALFRLNSLNTNLGFSRCSSFTSISPLCSLSHISSSRQARIPELLQYDDLSLISSVVRTPFSLLWGFQSSVIIFLVYVTIIIYLRGSILDREKRQRERELFHHLVHSPNGHNGQSWANPKPGASISSGFPWVQGPKHLSHLHCFYRPLSGSWIRSRATGTSTSTHMRC